jgi:putative intracellular protease/amidase
MAGTKKQRRTTDFRNAGATWVDEELAVCTDGPFNLISSRKPDDLPGSGTSAGWTGPT